MAFWSVLCAAVVGLAAAERCRVGQIFRPIVPADPQPDDSVQFDFGIAHIPHECTWLQLGDVGLGDKGCIALAHALNGNDQVTGVNIGSNDLGPECFATVAELVRLNTAITDLYMGHNVKAGDDGVAPLAIALTKSKSVKVLDLTDTNLSDESALALAHMLELNEVLSTLWIRNNQMTDGGMAILMDTLDCCNAHLTAIVCDDNPASAEMQKKLTDLGSEKRETHESQLHEDFRNEF